MKIVLAICSLLSLGFCLAASILYFLGYFLEEDYKLAFLLASIAWFFFAILWASSQKKKRS